MSPSKILKNKVSLFTLLFSLLLLPLFLACSDSGTDDSDDTHKTTTPVTVTDFYLTFDSTEAHLYWTTPPWADFHGIEIRRALIAAPLTHTDGVFVYSDTLTGDITDDQYLDINLTTDSTYYYSIFTYDHWGNYSDAVSDSIIPRAPQPISFPDSVLAAAIRTELGLAPMAIIYDNQALSLDTLSIADEIMDLTGLEKCQNLTYLKIWTPFSDTSDFSALGNLPKLQALNLRAAEITVVPLVISTITTLTNLSFLYSFNLSNINSLRNMPNIQVLDISNTAIEDLTVLSELPNLIELYASSIKCTIAPSLPNLTHLSMTSIVFDDISKIATMQKLQHLNLTSCSLSTSDIAPLAGLASLRQLWLWNNQIVDLTPLGNLDSLVTLYLRNNKVVTLQPLVDNENFKVYGGYSRIALTISDMPSLDTTIVPDQILILEARGVDVRQ